MALIRELYWRADREEHISRHSVEPVEVEDAIFGDASGLLARVGPAERDPNETVYRYFGRTEVGRHLMVALLYLGHGVAMPITARDMTTAERRRFNERRPQAR